MIERFKRDHADVEVKCILADALYGSKDFMDRASALFGGVQVVSELRCNQKVRFRGKELDIDEYFGKRGGTPFKIRIRGGTDVSATIGSARLHVTAHGKKRFVVALKY